MSSNINSIFSQGILNPFTKITQSSNYSSDVSSSTHTYITDSNFITTIKTTESSSEYIEVDLSQSVDLSSLQSIILYSDVSNNYNPQINKIRYETVRNVPLEISELQIWKNNSNILTTNNITTSGPVTQVTEDLVPFVPTAEFIWNGSYTTISTDYQFTYNGVTYLYWDKPLDSQTWMKNNGTNISTSGIAINSRIFSPTRSTPYYGYNEYARYMNLFDVRIKDYGNINNLTNYIDYSWAGLTLPIYIIWRTDGLKTANKLQLTCSHGFPDGMPKQFDIVSYTGTIPNFEDTSIVTNLQAITWNTITSINETNPYTVTTFSNDGYDSVETKSYDFTSTSANYFAIKIYDNFHATDDTISITDINWQNVSNVYTDASNITDGNFNTSYTSSQGVGEYIDVSLNNVTFNNLQAVILYNNANTTDLSNQQLTKLTFYDQSNISFAEINNSNLSNYNVNKFKGIAYNEHYDYSIPPNPLSMDTSGNISQGVLTDLSNLGYGNGTYKLTVNSFQNDYSGNSLLDYKPDGSAPSDSTKSWNSNTNYYVGGTSLIQLPTSISGTSWQFNNNQGEIIVTGETDSWKNGTYIATESLEQSWRAFYAFQSGLAWATTDVYSSGNYTGTESTSYSGDSVNGPWMQLQLPFLFKPTSYDITQDSATDHATNYTLLGSTDGSSWNLLHNNSSGIQGTVTNNITTSNTYSYYRIIASNNNGGTKTQITRVYFNGIYLDPKPAGEFINTYNYYGLDLSGEYLRLDIPQDIILRKTRVWGRNAYSQTDSSQSPQQYSVYQSNMNIINDPVVRIRRSSDNIEADFYNSFNNGLTTADNTTITSWGTTSITSWGTTSSVTSPTYDWDFRSSTTPSAVVDNITGTQTATLYNGVTLSTTNGAYFSGGANATAPYIDLQDFTLSSTLSFEFYVQFNDNTNWGRVFDFGQGQANNNILIARHGINSSFALHTSSIGNSSFSTITNNQFHHVVITISSTEAKYYVDGTSGIIITHSNIAPQLTRQNLWLARSAWTSDDTFNGYIKYFRIWNGYELTSSEANTLYNNRSQTTSYILQLSTLYITKLYNQSTIKTTPLIQPTNSNQPILDISNMEIIFDGSNSYMYAETPTDILDNGDDNYSYVTTANHTSESNDGNLMGFPSNTNSYSSNIYFKGSDISNNQTNLGFNGQNNDTFLTDPLAININTQYNIVMTIDNNQTNNINIWTNNSTTTPSKSTTTSNANGNLNLNNSNFYIGQYNSGHFFEGTAKAFYVFNKTLSTTEASLFNGTTNYSTTTPWINSNNLESYMTAAYSLYEINSNENFNFVSQVTDTGTENINTSPYYLECDCSNNNIASNSFIFSFPKTWGATSLSISEIRLYGNYYSLNDSSNTIISDLSSSQNITNISDNLISYYKKTKLSLYDTSGGLIKEIDNSIMDNSSVIFKYKGSDINNSITSDISGSSFMISDTPSNAQISITTPIFTQLVNIPTVDTIISDTSNSIQLSDLSHSFINKIKNTKIHLYDETNTLIQTIDNSNSDVSSTVFKYKGPNYSTYTNLADNDSILYMIKDSPASSTVNINNLSLYTNSFSSNHMIHDTTSSLKIIDLSSNIITPLSYYNISLIDESNQILDTISNSSIDSSSTILKLKGPSHDNNTNTISSKSTSLMIDDSLSNLSTANLSLFITDFSSNDIIHDTATSQKIIDLSTSIINKFKYTNLKIYNHNNILIKEINNSNLSNPIDTSANIFKYRGEAHDSNTDTSNTRHIYKMISDTTTEPLNSIYINFIPIDYNDNILIDDTASSQQINNPSVNNLLINSKLQLFNTSNDILQEISSSSFDSSSIIFKYKGDSHDNHSDLSNIKSHTNIISDSYSNLVTSNINIDITSSSSKYIISDTASSIYISDLSNNQISKFRNIKATFYDEMNRIIDIIPNSSSNIDVSTTVIKYIGPEHNNYNNFTSSNSTTNIISSTPSSTISLPVTNFDFNSYSNYKIISDTLPNLKIFDLSSNFVNTHLNTKISFYDQNNSLIKEVSNNIFDNSSTVFKYIGLDNSSNTDTSNSSTTNMINSSPNDRRIGLYDLSFNIALYDSSETGLNTLTPTNKIKYTRIRLYDTSNNIIQTIDNSTIDNSNRVIKLKGYSHDSNTNTSNSYSTTNMISDSVPNLKLYDLSLNTLSFSSTNIIDDIAPNLKLFDLSSSFISSLANTKLTLIDQNNFIITEISNNTITSSSTVIKYKGPSHDNNTSTSNIDSSANMISDLHNSIDLFNLSLYDTSFSTSRLLIDSSTIGHFDLSHSFISKILNTKITFYDESNQIMQTINNNTVDISSNIFKYKGENHDSNTNTSDVSSITNMISDNPSNITLNNLILHTDSFSLNNIIDDIATPLYINTDLSSSFINPFKHTKLQIYSPYNQLIKEFDNSIFDNSSSIFKYKGISHDNNTLTSDTSSLTQMISNNGTDDITNLLINSYITTFSSTYNIFDDSLNQNIIKLSVDEKFIPTIKNTKMTIFNNSNPIYDVSNTLIDISHTILKYKGISHSTATSSNIDSSSQMISDTPTNNNIFIKDISFSNYFPERSTTNIVDDVATGLIDVQLSSSFITSLKNTVITFYDQFNNTITSINNNVIDNSDTIIKYKGYKHSLNTNTSTTNSTSKMISDTTSEQLYSNDVTLLNITPGSNLIDDLTPYMDIRELSNNIIPSMYYTKLTMFDTSGQLIQNIDNMDSSMHLSTNIFKYKGNLHDLNTDTSNVRSTTNMIDDTLSNLKINNLVFTDLVINDSSNSIIDYSSSMYNININNTLESKEITSIHSFKLFDNLPKTDIYLNEFALFANDGSQNTITSLTNNYPNFSVNRLLDANIDFSSYKSSHSNGTNQYVEITLNQAIDTSNIDGIVIYNSTDTSNIKSTNITLYDQNNLVLNQSNNYSSTEHLYYVYKTNNYSNAITIDSESITNMIEGSSSDFNNKVIDLSINTIERIDTIGFDLQNTNFIDQSEMSHIALIMGNTELKLVVNGLTIASEPISSYFTNPITRSNHIIGYNTLNTLSISQFSIWDTELTNNQLLDLYTRDSKLALFDRYGLAINELLLFSNNQNISLLTDNSATKTMINSTTNAIEIINQDLSGIKLFDTSKIFIEFTLNNEIKIDDLQALVLYNNLDVSSNVTYKTTMYNLRDDIIYDISNNIPSYDNSNSIESTILKYKGPAYNTYTNFTNVFDFTGSQMISDTPINDSIYTQKLFVGYPLLNKIKIEEIDSSNQSISNNIYQLQVWIDGINVAASGIITIDSSNSNNFMIDNSLNTESYNFSSCELTLNSNYSIDKLNSIVIYNNGVGIKNSYISLIDNNNDIISKIYNSGNGTSSPVTSPTYDWNFRSDTTPSTVIDNITGTQTATLYNGVTLSTTNGAYFSGGLNSTGPYIDIQDFTLSSTLSFEFYVQFNDNASDGRIFDFGQGQANNNIIVCRHGTTSYFVLYTSSSGSSTFSTITNNQFHHVIVTISSTEAKYYVDGSSGIIITHSNIAPQLTRQNLWLARSAWTSEDTFNGYIKYFRIWNGYELTSSEAAILYTNRAELYGYISTIPNNINSSTSVIKYRGIAHDLNTNTCNTNSSSLMISDNASNLVIFDLSSNYIIPLDTSLNLTNGILNDSSSNHTRTSYGLNQYIDITLKDYVFMEDLESIVIYNTSGIDVGTYNNSTIKLYDTSNVLLHTGDNSIGTPNNASIIKYKGVSHDLNLNTSNIDSSTNMISDSASDIRLYTIPTESNAFLTSTITTNLASNIIDNDLSNMLVTDNINSFVELTLPESLAYEKLQSIVVYTNTDFSNTLLTIYDESSSIIDAYNNYTPNNYNIFKYKGLSYYNTIATAMSDSSTNIISDLSTNVQSNAYFNKIRLENTSNNSIVLNEIQLWINNNNLLSNIIPVVSSTSSGLANNITNGLFDLSLAFSTYSSINQFVEFNLPMYYSIDAIQGIIIYVPEAYKNNMINTRLKIYDTSESIIEIIDNINPLASTTGYEIYKYKGLDFTNAITSDVSSSTQMISDNYSSIRIVDLSFNSSIVNTTGLNSNVFSLYTGNNYDISDNGIISNSLHFKIFDSSNIRIDTIGEIVKKKKRIIQDQMYNIVIVSGSSQLKFYIDGELIASQSIPTYLQSQITRNNHFLGKGVTSNASISIPQMSIWNTELTSNEIQNVYNSDFSNNYYKQENYSINDFLNLIGNDASFNSVIDSKYEQFNEYFIDTSDNISISGFPSYIGTYSNNRLALKYINIEQPLKFQITKRTEGIFEKSSSFDTYDFTDTLTFGKGNHLFSDFTYQIINRWNTKLNNLITQNGNDLLLSNDLSGYRIDITTTENDSLYNDSSIFNFNTQNISSTYNTISFNSLGNNPGSNYTRILDSSASYPSGTIDWMSKHTAIISYYDNSSIKFTTDFSDNSGEFNYIIPTNYNGEHFNDSSNIKFYYYTNSLFSEEDVNIHVSDNFGDQSFSISKYNVMYKAVSTTREGGLANIPEHSNDYVIVDNSLNTSLEFNFYDDNSKNSLTTLMPGTIYDFKVSSENIINNTGGTHSKVINGYTGIYNEEFTKSNKLFNIDISNNFIYPVNNIYYRLDDPSVSLNTSRISSDLSGALIKSTLIEGVGNNLIFIKDIFANYKPNFNNISDDSYFEARITSSTINEDISGNILSNDVLFNTIGTNIDISNVNFGDDELVSGTKFGYFNNNDIIIKLKGFSPGIEIYDLSCCNYLINSFENLIDLSNKTITKTSLDASNILYGNNSIKFAVDNLYGNPSIGILNDTYIAASNPIYYNGIPSIKVFTINYGIDLSNIANNWTKETLCNVTFNNSNTVNKFNKDSTYYDYNDKTTVLVKSNLISSSITGFHLKSDNQNITLSNSVLFSPLTFNLTASNINSDQTIIHNKNYIQYDLSNESHHHILNNNTNVYGERIFFNENIDYDLSYPSLANIIPLDNSANYSIDNYNKESILFDGFYCGSNTLSIKKNWTLLMEAYNNVNKFDYTNINNNRFVSFKFTKNLTSNELLVNIIENSHNDKQLYIKYKTTRRETVWFNGNVPFNGRSVYAPRNNGDGIRLQVKNINEFFINCPIGDNIIIYITIKIPNTNSNSKFKYLTLINV